MARTLVVDLTFAKWLRAELDVRGWGVRTLARTIDSDNPEVPRRALNRFMRGSMPSEPYAVSIAEAFGVSRDALPIPKEAARAGDSFRGSGGAASADRGGDGAGSDAGKGRVAA